MSSIVRVLHVVESFGGGVATALAQYATATPTIEHHLLKAEREGDYIDGGELKVFASVSVLPRNPLVARRIIRGKVKSLDPSVVHAHSSFAGAYVRSSVRATKNMKIIYTPHGYSFERGDISFAARSIYRAIETVLARNTTAYAACSPREVELSRFKGYKGQVTYVPNVVAALEATNSSVPVGPLSVVSVGRLTPARDPFFFVKMVERVQAIDPEVRFAWVGGGDAVYVRALELAGVHVTGWLARDEARAILQQANVHTHTASWDGFPMVLLEANTCRIPSLVRNIAPFSSVPVTLRSSTPEEMAHQVLALRDKGQRESSVHLWDEYLAENTVDVQYERLMSMYAPTS
ncbi:MULTISPECIES: glycosyltransferase [unclassified Arthrobacter]|uniref:glycosyltransferase n=1 Tax=unclassified Arthrobacter TaxID=235627 RepID=UPI000CE3954B|nr:MULTISPECIES: glycosyltransferase [unclassified Arthrobacter]